ncbi:PLP-dependent aminotransferase family protein [Sphingomonas bacterium]|uniref:MocR-like pyridoxine biosynthesis transcription factor PdxR n=1 Tax=Sphingomonas bacterium TaxID=1895847 RepID=UPI001575483A|nr:PLP-dependent aminotransferase family protein [Sphingomonas bacterium]
MPLLDALSLDLGRRKDVPLWRQIRDEVMDGIARGTIRPGERLPSTRDLAQAWGVSRNTVVLAFEQLAAEGLVEGLSGSGTYVAPQPPARTAVRTDPHGRINPAILAAGSLDRAIRGSSALTQVHATLRHMRRPVAFRSNFPAIDAFPIQLWAKLAADIYRRLDATTANDLMGEGDPQGYLPLREAIAAHVADGRGIACSADDIIIFAGVQQAVDLACRLLLIAGDKVLCEDPGYPGICASVTAAGSVPVSAPVDAHGMDVHEALRRAPDARMAYTTPSKQFPTGVTLDMERRRALVDWADRVDGWIIEDDYDSEFRYTGRALPTLFEMDRSGRVLYLGTFSKTLFPALRLGFAILPPPLVEAFVSARTVVGRYSPILDQVLVARFMQEGHFASHVRKMRKLYLRRQACLLDAVRTHLSDYLVPQETDTGMEIVATLRGGIGAHRLADAAAAQGLEIMPLSSLAREVDADRQIALGFSAFSPDQITDGVARLQAVCRGLS